MTATIAVQWIAVDWGTSNLRAWAMGPDGPLAEAVSDDGMGKLSRDAFEPALLALIAPWLGSDPVRIICCGMVGSRQGWFEAPYRATPCAQPDAADMVQVPTKDSRLDVWIVPGLMQPSPADVMRGEETQIAGALALTGAADGVMCLPGTHTKWVQLSAAKVASFQTFMTGEMFALLSGQSVLRYGMTDEGWDDDAFDMAVSETLSRPEGIAAKLFGLRAEGLIAGLASAQARARLSGLLIGAELAAARPYWLGQPVAIVGAVGMSNAYARALAAQGVGAQMLSATECTLAGLSALARAGGRR